MTPTSQLYTIAHVTSFLFEIWMHLMSFILLGDLNDKHSDWNPLRGNSNGTTLHRYTQKNNVILTIPGTPTYFYSNLGDVTRPQALPELPFDHDPVALTLRGLHTRSLIPIRNTVRSYKNTNWQLYSVTLDTLIHVESNTTIIEQLEQLHSFMLNTNTHRHLISTFIGTNYR